MGWLRRKFLTGLVILLPTVLTGWILYKAFISMDNILRPLVEKYPFLDIPGLGLIAVIILILVAGVFAGNFIGRKILRWTEGVVTRIPLVNRMYTAIKQTSQVFLRHERTVFKEAILIQYPRPGIFVVGFVTSTWVTRIGDGPEKKYINVFMPTTPVPTSGLFLMIPEEEAIPMNASVEDALKLVISGGAVIPPVNIDSDQMSSDIS
jgi:uncharacterized membrane protein